MKQSENDIQWSQLNKESMEYAKSGDWGLYRNTHLYMAYQLKKEKKYEAALQMFLEVCYLDLNGPNNNGYFSPDDEAFAPRIIKFIQIEMRRQKLDISKVKGLFIEHADFVGRAMKLSVDPIAAWSRLENELT